MKCAYQCLALTALSRSAAPGFHVFGCTGCARPCLKSLECLPETRIVMTAMKQFFIGVLPLEFAASGAAVRNPAGGCVEINGADAGLLGCTLPRPIICRGVFRDLART